MVSSPMNQRIVKSKRWILIGGQFIEYGDMFLMPLFGVLLQIIQHDTPMTVNLNVRNIAVFKQPLQCSSGDA